MWRHRAVVQQCPAPFYVDFMRSLAKLSGRLDILLKESQRYSQIKHSNCKISDTRRHPFLVRTVHTAPFSAIHTWHQISCPCPGLPRAGAHLFAAGAVASPPNAGRHIDHTTTIQRPFNCGTRFLGGFLGGGGGLEKGIDEEKHEGYQRGRKDTQPVAEQTNSDC